MLALSTSGLLLFGMLSQVLRPIITTFAFSGGADLVTRAKYAISDGSRHGRRDPCPIPFVQVAATMRVSEAITDYVILAVRLNTLAYSKVHS